MFATFLSAFQLGLVVNLAIFIVTLIFAQKIKDWMRGIPTDVRKALNGVEASALGNVQVAQNAVLSQLASALPPVVATKPTIIPAAPVAPVANTAAAPAA